LTSGWIRGKLASGPEFHRPSRRAHWDIAVFPQPISWSERPEPGSNPLAQPDLAQALEQQIAAGFPPGLALDLVLNELVVRAAAATHAQAAALALKRGEEIVCRAATGEQAPDLGIHLSTSDGVSGACLRTRQSQLCLDTQTDPRVDAATCHRLGIRSMLVVPVLEGEELAGVLEVFATAPAEFVDSDQNLLETFARECTRIQRAALELDQRLPAEIPASPSLLQAVPVDPGVGWQKTRAPYEIWTLVLGALAILLTIAMSFMIGSRIGWLGWPSPRVRSPAPPPATNSARATTPQTAPAKQSPRGSSYGAKSSPDSAGGLVVYDQGKVVFRLKPSAQKAAKEVTAAGGTTGAAPVWLAADLAESRLLQRNEPEYPADALAAHRAGEVVLEVVVGEDGAVASMRPMRGDPVLAAAAADAVRTWRYEPYRVKGHPTRFQTDVTLKFSLPD
jgi:TonB family protein